MRANLYVGVLIGVLIFVAIIWYTNRGFGKVEGFADAITVPVVNPTSTPVPTSFESILAALNADPANYKYVEKKENIPGQEKLQLYYSCFSDKTLADEDSYVPSTLRWNNHLAKDQALFLLISGGALPANIKPPNGLPTNNLSMNGISSDQLIPASTTPILTSFTVSCYARFNPITFTDTNPIEIFNIYLESPNYARLELRPSKKPDNSIDPTNVDIVLQVGGPDNIYTVTKPKDALLASGNFILFSFVYDESSGKVFLYIGSNETDNYTAEVKPKPTMILGNSPIRINRNADLNMNLQALAIYNTALTFETHKALLTYFTEQQSGVASILQALKVMSTVQIKAVQTYVQDQTVTIEDLKKQLATCEATPKKEEEKKFKYGVKMPTGAEDVSAADLESCSILSVKKRPVTAAIKDATAASTPATATTTTPTATTPTAAAPKSRFAIDIPFLKDILPKAFTTESVTPTAPKA